MSVYRLIRQIWPYVGPVVGFLALGAWLGITIGQVVTAIRYALPYVLTLKVTWLLLALLSFFFAYVETRHRGVPLTAVKTMTEITLESPDGRSAFVKRTQKLRANHENVTGYHRRAATTGSIEASSIGCSISHCGADRQHIVLDGTPQAWEIIHRFEPIPRKLLLLGLNTVERSDWMRLTDGFCEQSESYEFGVFEKYRHEDVTVRIYFHPQRHCLSENCYAIWISDNGVVDIPLTQLAPNAQGYRGVEIRVKRPRPGDKFRIYWTYPKIAQTEVVAVVT